MAQLDLELFKLLLDGFGAPLGQGYLFSKPVTAQEAGAWLTPEENPMVKGTK